MGVAGPFSSSSTAKDIDVSPTGASQVAFGKGSTIANPGAVVLGRDANLNLGTEIFNDLRRLRLGRNAQINIDASTPQSSSDPALIAALAAFANANATPTTPPAGSGTATTPATTPAPAGTLAERISNTIKGGLAKLRALFVTENADGSTSVKPQGALIAVAVVIVLYLVWRRFFRK